MTSNNPICLTVIFGINNSKFDVFNFIIVSLKIVLSFQYA